ncbi:MAG: replicative DNA helicase [Parvibaculaceae bacterium]|nr:replicative DNA helicase [Parvibaculaceae bacterium]
MALSAPIFQLKRTAKALSRTEEIPLNQALNRVAIQEGFSSWSQLVSSPSALSLPAQLFNQLEPGDLLLLGGRPQQGKTAMALKVLVEAMKRGHQGVFFTLDYNKQDIAKLFAKIGTNSQKFENLFRFDNSDEIDAHYIMQRMGTAPSGAVIVIDYLQLLDQRRRSPIISVQVEALKSFAHKHNFIIVFISQIDRSFELSAKPFPDRQDVRLPNPLDLSLFNKACFVNDGQAQM